MEMELFTIPKKLVLFPYFSTLLIISFFYQLTKYKISFLFWLHHPVTANRFPNPWSLIWSQALPFFLKPLGTSLLKQAQSHLTGSLPECALLFPQPGLFLTSFQLQSCHPLLALPNTTQNGDHYRLTVLLLSLSSESFWASATLWYFSSVGLVI